MTTLPESPPSVIGETVATAIGRAHRDDRVSAITGGPAGNARLTAWLGLTLLAVSLVECATLISMSHLLAVHIFVGALLVPLILAKTGTTGWRMLRYYARSEEYVDSGPPPLLLRVLGPLVVVGALTVVGTGLSLIALGPSAKNNLFTIAGFGVGAVTLHQAAFVLWLSTTGLHVLGRFVPALQLSRLAPVPAPHDVPRRLPGTNSRVVLLGLTAATSIATGALVLSLSGSWTNAPWH
jgi:hypothetical protein